jgi:hypothetical protein
MLTPLPYDYARCSGTTHATCQNCRRRELGRPEWQSYMAAPIALDGACSGQIPYVGQVGKDSLTTAAT